MSGPSPAADAAPESETSPSVRVRPSIGRLRFPVLAPPTLRQFTAARGEKAEGGTAAVIWVLTSSQIINY